MDKKIMNVACYIINLERDTSKKKTMQQECRKVGLTPIFTKAVYGANLSQSEIDKVYDKKAAIKYFNRELTKGEIGTVLSHLHIYSEIIDHNLPFALVLEDDITLPNNFHTIIKQILQKAPKDFEIILLGHHIRRSRKKDGIASIWNRLAIDNIYKCIRFSESVVGAYAYIITDKGANKMIEKYSIIDRPIDHWSESTVNLYGIIPSLVNVVDLNNQESLLSKERNRLIIKRTKYEQFKDKIQFLLKKLHLFEYVFLIKEKIIQFKKLKNYT